jgi:hypothetical protein
MIIKYEKLESKEELIEGKSETTTSFKEVEKEVDADYIHICGHDTNPPTPCRRERIKK